MFFDASLLKYIKNPSNYYLALDLSDKLVAIEKNPEISTVANFSISQEKFKLFLYSAANNAIGNKLLIALRRYEIKPNTTWSKELYFNLFKKQELINFEHDLIGWVEKHIGYESSYMYAVDAARKIRQAYIFESTSLNLSDHYLIDLPNCLGSLRALQEINLDNNRLNILPDTIVNISGLQKLNLRNNLFPIIPEILGEFKALKELNIGNNKIISGLSHLQSCFQIGVLYLDGNSISSDILNFPKLKDLHYLSLAFNQIEDLGEKVFTCNNIRYLNLSNNKLKQIPSEIKNFNYLINLNLSSNFLEVINEELEGLKNLENLNISKNKIENLPIFWKKLKELILFTCDENPIKEEIEFFDLVLFFVEENKKYFENYTNNFSEIDIYKYFIKPGLKENLLDFYKKIKSEYLKSNTAYRSIILKAYNNAFSNLIDAKKENETFSLKELINKLIDKNAIHFVD